MNNEERVPSKRNVIRHKLQATKKFGTILISLFQSSVLTSIEKFYCCKLEDLLDEHTSLLSHLLRSRVAGAQIGLDSNAKLSSKNGDGKGDKKENASNMHKKRCQELITQPHQFSKDTSGVVILGEKLLSNYKGIDFTLSLWVFVSKKSPGKNNFITGKVSHNDAWPLVLFRGADQKLDIVYGRGNDFEKLTSQTTIEYSTWTHIAIVVEPRKIKVFINGTQDCQVSTPGNARAILYPVIIGTCPPSIRTRIEHIRDGLDGMISQ